MVSHGADLFTNMILGTGTFGKPVFSSMLPPSAFAGLLPPSMMGGNMPSLPPNTALVGRSFQVVSLVTFFLDNCAAVCHWPLLLRTACYTFISVIRRMLCR